MTKEDKELLLKDLCARLPYGVRCEVNTHTERLDSVDPFEETATFGFQTFDISEVKPYLRPMSSMTEEEVIEFNNIPSTKNYQIVNGDLPWDVANYKQLDWLLKNHFDFRNLIEKGLAIAVTEENNPYKE